MTFVLADSLDDALAVSMPQEFHDLRKTEPKREPVIDSPAEAVTVA